MVKNKLVFSLSLLVTLFISSSLARATSCVTSSDTGQCPSSGAYAESSNFTESNGYNTYVDNGVSGGYGVSPETQTLTATSGSSWSVSSDFGSSTHQLAYPITLQDYNSETVSSFTNIVGTVNDTIPSNSSTGVEAGFLIYLNSWGNSFEIQHYVEKESTCNGTTPVKTSVSFGGSYGVPTNSWDLCYNGSIYYWQIVGSGSSWGFTSGSVEIISMIEYLENNGYLPTGSKMSDIRYGFMIYTTGSTQETFTLNSYTLINNASSSSPTISLSPTSLSFSATAGGSNPVAKNVTVSNSGGGTLASPTTTINYGSGSGWLSVAARAVRPPIRVPTSRTYREPGGRDLHRHGECGEFGCNQHAAELHCHADGGRGIVADHLAIADEPELYRNGGRLESGIAERHREQLRWRHAGGSDSRDPLRHRKRLAQCETGSGRTGLYRSTNQLSISGAWRPGPTPLR